VHVGAATSSGRVRVSQPGEGKLIVELNLGIFVQDKFQVLSILVHERELFLVGGDFLDLALGFQGRGRTREAKK
jgi:hypothetical protein